jgi:hypothetical protein
VFERPECSGRNASSPGSGIKGAEGRRARDSRRSASSLAASSLLDIVLGLIRDAPERPENIESGEASRRLARVRLASRSGGGLRLTERSRVPWRSIEGSLRVLAALSLGLRLVLRFL